MSYRKITIEIVVAEDDQEACIQAFNNAIDQIEYNITFYSSDIMDTEAPTPENATEIAAVSTT